MKDAPIVIDPQGEARHLIIWLHGLGADGSDFVPVAESLELPPELGVRHVFPHAPVRPVSINGGMAMRAWYDVRSADMASRADGRHLLQSVELVGHLLAEENARGMPLERMILAGFSQGGTLALHTALQLELPLAGVAAMSTYLPLREHLPEEGPRWPLFLAHGVDDGVIPYAESLSALDWLRVRGHAVDWHNYPMMHEVCAEEIDDLRRWLLERLEGDV